MYELVTEKLPGLFVGNCPVYGKHLYYGQDDFGNWYRIELFDLAMFWESWQVQDIEMLAVMLNLMMARRKRLLSIRSL